MFCPRCGGKLDAPPPTECAHCSYHLFVNARPTGSLVVADGDRFLALRRVMEPQAGRWEAPGGFCDGWEHPAEAAVREAQEELGVRVTLRDFVGMYVGSYQYQDESLPVLDCFWLATIDEGQTVVLDPAESSECAWFPLADPPSLAFTTHDRAVRDACDVWRGVSAATESNGPADRAI